MSTFERNRLYRYRSPTGAVGAGFLIEFGGREQHSVAWPDGPAQRYKSDELAELGIRCDEAELEPESPERSEPPTEPEETEAAVTDESPQFAFRPEDTEANNIREYLRTFPEAENQEVIGVLHRQGMEVSSSQVSSARKQLEKIAAREAAAQQPNSEGEAAKS